MFYTRLAELLYEHASFYRAITIDEYECRIVDIEFQNEEFEKLVKHWNKAVKLVDNDSISYTVDIFSFMATLGWDAADYSEWEVEFE